MELQLDRNVKLRDLNEHISCYLCGGYLVDATTITECIHTFCRSCLVNYIEEGKHNCPKCSTTIHHSYPLQYIAHDRTMQDIVEKLVPNLYQNEWNRKLKFYADNNLTMPQKTTKLVPSTASALSPAIENGRLQNYHREDEQVDIFLKNANCSMKPLKRPFVQCSVHATIKILKKFLARNLGLGINRHGELDILCNNEILGKDHTLMFIMITRWRSKKPPLHLEYRPRITLL